MLPRKCAKNRKRFSAFAGARTSEIPEPQAGARGFLKCARRARAKARANCTLILDTGIALKQQTSRKIYQKLRPILYFESKSGKNRWFTVALVHGLEPATKLRARPLRDGYDFCHFGLKI